jgi:hypothetical protein
MAVYELSEGGERVGSIYGSVGKSIWRGFGFGPAREATGRAGKCIIAIGGVVP